MRRMMAALAFALALSPAAAHAQFLPEAGPGVEQQEFGTTLFLGPEATVLGGFLGGGAVYAVEKNFTTRKGDDPAVIPVAVGAGVGAAIAAAWAQRSISGHFHPGSHLNSAIGAAAGAAIGAALYFGGPPAQDGNERALRTVSFLLAPSVLAYAGWHVGEESGGFDSVTPSPVWAGHLYRDPAMPRARVVTATLRF